MRISSLLDLSEAATGYTGGSYTDELPHLSLVEAAGMFPAAIVEAQMAFNDNKIKTIGMMTEAAVNAVTYGSNIDIGPIVEASLEGLKNKIKSFFDKIFKWLKSIIAKITLQIDKIRMSGHQLYTKYKNDTRYRGKNFKDLVVSGYKFEHGDNPFPDAHTGVDDPERLVKAGLPKELQNKKPSDFVADMKSTGGFDHDSDSEKNANKSVEALQDVSTEDRQLEYAKILVGSKYDISAGTWVADIKKELWGEKVDLKYGTDFSESTISALLEKPLALDKIKKDYITLERAARKHHDALQSELNTLEKEMSRARSDSSNKGDEERKKVDQSNNALSVASAYYTEYMKYVSDTYAVINQIKNLEVQYQTDRVNQAKRIFGKMLSYNAKKNNNDATSEDAEIELFDFAL